ncbi:cinnamoyl-CoA reductase 1-like [Cicer arietinum]|uniref:Cinnamoyl-CoA reductase 2-like n=1 Tax=Cicer arietinum TaxID=3827 RepID=A0A1S2Z5Q8_CICAR|nr:cinnamoyl-CoA reductase 2-like [Cicer arietinum]
MATSDGIKKVCVTGAGGFVASWLVKVLLSKGYSVHGTVRQPGSQKYEHLLKLERASENLTLYKADILNYESVYSAIVGCSAVFHVACPVPSTELPNPEVEVIEPAVKGTVNVLEACLKAKVERVVFVSSAAAVVLNPNFPKDKVFDESCWSDKDYCKETKNWYCYSKTEAEEQALNFAKRTGLSVVSICPTLVLGPILQSTTNASSLAVIKLLKGYDSLENKHRWIVDVRDLVDAILLAYEKHDDAEARYICTSHGITTRDLAEKLKSIYPNYKYPTNYIEVDDYKMLSSEKLKSLGWKYRTLEETLIDSVESYKEAGLLQSQ